MDTTDEIVGKKMEDIGPERYVRQTILPEIGVEGQRKLARASAVVIGVGGLGTVSALNLVRMGVGRVRLADRDLVDLSNLHRQRLFAEEDVGKEKAEAAAARLRKINGRVEVEALVLDVNFGNIERLIKEADVVLDGTDNLETRFLINDACVKAGIPWIYGGAIGTQGMTMNIVPGKTACFRCFIEKTPGPGLLPTCDTAGVLGTIPAMIGNIQSTEAVRLIVNDGTPDEEGEAHGIASELLVFDVWRRDVRTVRVNRKEDCGTCVRREFDYLNLRKRTLVTKLCGKHTVQIVPVERKGVSLEELGARLEGIGEVEREGDKLTFRVEDHEIVVFKDGRALVNGVEDEATAKGLYSRYVGM